jgi:hypothetical protein
MGTLTSGAGPIGSSLEAGGASGGMHVHQHLWAGWLFFSVDMIKQKQHHHWDFN